MADVKILLVEDESIEAMDIKRTLESFGYDVPAIVSSGEEVLEKIDELKPDLILMDIVLKGELDGVECAKKIREQLNIPVIYLTAHSEESMLQQAKFTEPYGFLLKPFDQDELKSTIEIALYKHESERKIKDSEARFRSLYENSFDAILLTNPDGSILSANPAAQKMFGMSEEEIIKAGRSGLVVEDENLKHVLKEREQKSKVRAILTYKRKDGSTFLAEGTSSLFTDEDRSIKTSMILRDVTEIRKAEEALRESENRFKELFNNIGSGVAVFEAAKDGGDFIFKDFNIAAEIIEKVKREDLIGRSVLEAFPGVKDFGLFDVFQRVYKTGKPEHHPITLYKDERITGWRDNYVYKLPSEEIVAVYEDITERKKAEKALKESKERYQMLFDNSQICTAITTMEGEVINANQGFFEMTGYKRGELNQIDIRTMYQDVEQRNNLIEILKKEGKIRGYEVNMRRKDGQPYLASINVDFITLEGKKEMLVTAIDITKRRQAEDELIKSEAFLNKIIDLSPTPIWISDEVGTLKRINRACCELLNITEDEVIGKYNLLKDNIVKEQGLMPLVESVFKEGKIARFKLKYNTSRLETLDLEKKAFVILNVTIFPITDAKGKVTNAVIQHIDITEREKYEEKLYKSQNKLKIAMDLAKLVQWEYDVDSDMFTFDDQFYALYGTSADKEGGNKMSSEDYASRFIPPEESGLVASEIVKALETDDPNYFATLDHKIIRADGEERYITVRFGVIKDAEGRTIKTYGANQDITERKKMEDALIRQKENYQTIFDSVPAMVWYVDVEGKVLRANKYISKLMGKPAEDLVGKSFYDIFPAHEAVKFYKDNMEVINSKKPKLQIIESYTAANNEKRWAQTDKIPYLDQSGDVVGVIVFVQDITDRVKFEREVKDIEERQRRLLRESFDGVIIHSEGKILSINQKGAEILGAKSPEEIVERPIIHIVHPDYHEIIKNRIKKMKSEGSSVPLMEQKFLKLDGEVIDVEVVATVYKHNNRLGVYAVFRDITARKKAEKRLIKSLEEKEVMLREIHHRVKNNLQVISSLLNLQSQHLRNEYDMEVFKESQNRVKSMAMIHERLYQTQDFAHINIAEHIRNLVLGLFSSYHVDQSSVKLNTNIQDLKLGIDTAIPLSLIINELVTNSIKHAFPEGQTGEINIELIKTDEKTYKLTISDNGIGIPEDLELQKTGTLGLQLVNNLTNQLDGTIKLDRTKGTQFQIKFNQLIYKKRE